MLAPRAVLLDALGTLVAMEPPAPHLRAELARRAGVDVSPAVAEAAFGAEIAFYIEHHLEGRDERTLAELRDRCTQVLGESLGDVEVNHETLRAAMLASLRFRAQPDAEPALRALRRYGPSLVATSNWDCSLDRVLEAAGLRELLDGVVASAQVGAAKPDRRLFAAALDAAGVAPEDAVHVGDSPDHDLAGARAAGLGAVLLDRSGEVEHPGVPVIRTLEEIPSLLFGSR